LGALSIEAKIPNSRTLDDVIEGEAGGKNTDLVERWRETFYENRGECNRD